VWPRSNEQLPRGASQWNLNARLILARHAGAGQHPRKLQQVERWKQAPDASRGTRFILSLSSKAQRLAWVLAYARMTLREANRRITTS